MFNVDLSMIKRGQTVAVGLSGGVDSVSLLYYLNEKRGEIGFDLVAINVEHGIRGDASKSDSAFCVSVCKKLNVKLKKYSVNALSYAKENGYSLEQAARILRYNCFFDAISTGFCDVVAVAHHLSDNAETILFNILRGASASGAKGIMPSAYSGKIIRPFLNVKKEDIFAFSKERGIDFVHDETNDDTAYTRNAIRQDIAPKLKRIFPEYEQALSRFADTLASDDEFLYSLAKKACVFDGDRAIISCAEPYPVFSRAVILALKRLGVEKDYEKQHVDAVYSLRLMQTGKKIELPKNVYAIKVHDNIEIKLKTVNNRPIAPFTLGKTVLCGVTITAEKIAGTNAVDYKTGQYFDLDKLPVGCVFRKKEDGDEFTKFNGQKVSLKKFLTDKKIPADEKNAIFVLAKEKTVYLIVGLEISYAIKIDNSTENIVKLSCT